jgi:hypothetical protein
MVSGRTKANEFARLLAWAWKVARSCLCMTEVYLSETPPA